MSQDERPGKIFDEEIKNILIDGVIFSDKAVVVSQDERPGLGQGQEEADLGARHRPGRECGQHQEELQQAPPLHHHQGQTCRHAEVK